MSKIITYKCDRCGKIQNTWKDLAHVTFIGKQIELCKKCQEDFKIWFKQKGEKQEGEGDEN